MEKSQRSSGKGLMNQIVTVRRCFAHSEKMDGRSGYSKTGSLISYRLTNKELMGITQRFLPVGRNDESGEIAMAKKIMLAVKQG